MSTPEPGGDLKGFTQETIVEMRWDSYQAQLRQMVEAGRARNDPTLAIAVSLDALAALLDELDRLRAARETVPR